MKLINIFKPALIILILYSGFCLAQENPFAGKWTEKDHADLPVLGVDDLQLTAQGEIKNNNGEIIGSYSLLKNNFIEFVCKKGKVRFEYQFLKSQNMLWLSTGVVVYELKRSNW